MVRFSLAPSSLTYLVERVNQSRLRYNNIGVHGCNKDISLRSKSSEAQSCKRTLPHIIYSHNNLSRLLSQKIYEHHNTNKSGSFTTEICSDTKQNILALSTLKSFSFTSSRYNSSLAGVNHGTPVFPDLLISQSILDSSNTLERYTDPNAVFVVTGASRGIGLQFVKALIERSKGNIVACCRNPLKAEQLNEYRSLLSDDKSKRICIVPIDMEDGDSVVRAATEIKNVFGRVDVLLNVAGILGDGGISTPGPERSLDKIDRQWLEKSLFVNVVGPVQFTKELAPVLSPTKRSKKDLVKSDLVSGAPVVANLTPQQRVSPAAPALVVNISARVGSISENTLGGWHSYRMSKAALNQATRTMALELKRAKVNVVSLYPGMTDTDLSKPFQRNVKGGSVFPVTQSVDQLLKVMDVIDEKSSGGFYDWAGKAIPF